MDTRFTKSLFFSISLISTLFLMACGGGGGGGGNNGGGGTTPTTYAVSATAGQGGSIAPANRSVTSGQTTSFTLTANSGYRITGATGCNGNLVGNLYTTGAISADCAVTANFVAETIYSVTTSKNAGGNISPASASVIEGKTTSFTITPDEGYRIANVTGCNGTREGNNFTTMAMTANCVVNVSFEVQQFTISTEVIGPGEISPVSATISYGQDAIFNNSYQAGYSVSLLPGCNAFWGAEGIKIHFVTEDCTLRLKYEPVDYEITATVEGNGSISPAKVSAHYGDELRFIIQPGAGNRFSYSKGCDGYFDSKDSVFIIPSVTGTCQLQVSFHDERYVYFADPALEQKVREALAIAPEQPILPGELDKLERLEAGSSRIKQLDGLEYAKNLKYLSLENNQITSLRPLANLALQSLSISDNPITDQQLAFLAHSPLQYLFMDSTKVTNLTSLASKTQLNYLSIQYTQVTDLAPLQQLGNLDILQAMYTSVTDISPLLGTGLAKLSSVTLGGCLVTKGFSRALPIVEALREKDIHVTLIEPRIWDQQKCPDNRILKNVLLGGNLDNGELELNWQVTSDDPGPWQCELHLNLDSQLPRIPTRIIENCHTQTSIRIPGFNLNEYSPSLRVSTGIYNEHLTSAPTNIVSTQKPQTASLHSYDWAQTLLKTNPLLVPGKEASLRLHVTAQTTSPIPIIEVYALLNNKREAVPVTPPTALPTGKRHDNRDQSFFSRIPAHLMQPGLTLEVFLEGTKQLTLTPTFSKVSGIHLRLIPLQTDGQISALPSDTVVRNSLTRYWPIGDIQISHRAPYQLSKPAGENTIYTMLNELADLHAVENGAAYYYGYFDRQLRNGWNFDGLGNTPGWVAVGVNDRINDDGIDTVLAHELGHNFSLPHAPCGSASGSDPAYPYNLGSIGSYGTDQGYTKIFNPDLKDVMGYCGFDHVSDYNYEKAQDYLDGQAGRPHVITTTQAIHAQAQKPNTSTTTSPASSLYLRITVDKAGAQIAQQISLPHLPALLASNSHKAVVHFADGSQQTLPVAELHLGHGGIAGEYQLQLAIPTDKQRPTRFILLEGQKELLEYALDAATAITQKSVAAQRAKTNGTIAQRQFLYRNNEICVEIGATQRRHVNLLWHHSEGVMALALNETANQFCRSLSGVPAGEPELQVF